MCCCSELTDEEKGKDDAVAEVQKLIDSLPDAESITAENAEHVAAQLDAIDAAKAALSDEQTEGLNLEKYITAAQALGAVYDAQVLTGSNVAKAGDTEYATLAEAVANAPDGGTVTLLDNITITDAKAINIDKNLTIDLNQRILTATELDNYLFACNTSGVSVEIKNGSISSNMSAFSWSEGSLTLTSVKVTVQEERGIQMGNAEITIDKESVVASLGGEYPIYIHIPGADDSEKPVYLMYMELCA